MVEPPPQIAESADALDAQLPWWSTGRVLRRRLLSTERIVEAALGLADREGLDALSMRRLGSELGTGATSTYWHVPNKDALLDLMLDRLMAEIDEDADLDPQASWRAQLATFARSLRRVLARHAGAAPLLGSRLPVGPNGLRLMDRMLGVLEGAGFRGRAQALAYGALSGYAAGQAVLQSRRLRTEAGPGVGKAVRQDSPATHHQRELGSLLARAPRTSYPHVHAQAAEMAGLTDEEQFEYGLQRLLDGLESGSSPPNPRRRLF